MVKEILIEESLDKEVLRNLIIKSVEENVVEKEKCSKPKIIQDLPHDLRTNDKDELNERLSEARKLYNYTESEFKRLNKEYTKLNQEHQKLERRIDEGYVGFKEILDSIFKETDKKGRDYFSDPSSTNLMVLDKNRIKEANKNWKKLYDVTHQKKTSELMDNIEKLLDGEDIPLNKFNSIHRISDTLYENADKPWGDVEYVDININIHDVKKHSRNIINNIPDYKKVSKELESVESEVASVEANMDDLDGEIKEIQNKLR